jgi:trigger factor
MPGRQVALTIELEPDMVNTALDRAYRQMVNQVNIPGFRRGKAPRYVFERYVSKDTLTERAVKNILPQTLQDAIAEQNIEAMDVGDVEIVSMDPVQVKVIVVQPPLVELGDYGSIRAEKEPVEVTPEQVEEVLMELRREGAPWNEPAEPRPTKEGDMVYLDLEGFTGDGELEEAKRENFPTIVGMLRAGIPDAVNQALVGMSVGDEKDIATTLPDDYPVEALQGRDVSYHVAVRSMKEQQLPELNDEFAKGMGFDTVEALRETVENNLRRRTEEAVESKQINSIIDQMVESSNVEAPDVMVTEELDRMLKSLENRLKQQQPISLRQYFTYTGSSEPEWREANRDRARERVARSLVLQEFARREGISVDDSEVETEVDQIIERFEGQEKEQARSVLGGHEARHDLEDRLFQRKIVDRLVDIAEGRAQAAPAPTSEGEAAEDQEAGEKPEPKRRSRAKASTEETQGDASDLESAGGAAELLGTSGVDVRSENESGDASGGGTPATAPALDAEKK